MMTREAASSFEGKPLLVRHIAIDAQNPHQEAVVGTIGKVTYEHPYLIARPILSVQTRTAAIFQVVANAMAGTENKLSA